MSRANVGTTIQRMLQIVVHQIQLKEHERSHFPHATKLPSLFLRIGASDAEHERREKNFNKGYHRTTVHQPSLKKILPQADGQTLIYITYSIILLIKI